MSQRRGGAKTAAEEVTTTAVAKTGVTKGSLSLETEETVPLSKDDGMGGANRKTIRMEKWLESPFACGLTEPTWLDERRRRSDSDDDLANTNDCVWCSSFCCPYFGAERVGHMVICHKDDELVEEVDVDEETGEEKIRRFKRPRLNWMMGPYWPMLMLVTYPLILGVSGWTFKVAILSGRVSQVMIFVWTVCTVGLIVALACTAFRDPGILYRHKSPPPQSENTWRWSDQAQSYRPRGAHFDSDTYVVIEEFDHTCPWTGTAIGKKNMLPFQFFVCLVFVCMIMDIFLCTGVLDSHRVIRGHH